MGALALASNVATQSSEEPARPQSLEAFDVSDIPRVDIATPQLAMLLAPGDSQHHKLKLLLKRSKKLQQRLAKAQARRDACNVRLATFQAELTLANALPDASPKQQKAKAKTIKKLQRKLNHQAKKSARFASKIVVRQTQMQALEGHIASIDPDAVTPSHLLEVSPGALVFSGTVGGQAPATQQVTLKNLSLIPMTWGGFTAAPWVDFSPSSGTLKAGASTTVTITVDGTGLTTGSYTAKLIFGAPESTNAPSPVAVALSLTPPAVQTGLLGEYFDDTNLSDFVQTRFDPNVDFTTWAGAPTGTATAPDYHHSERWTGFVSTPTAGTWTFSTLSNDGVRLWIDNVLIINNWTNHSAAQDEGQITLTAGWHSVRLEHYQANGSVVIQLSYSGPGQSETVIPTNALATTLGGNQPPSVSAGVDQQILLPTSTAQLSGTATDLDGQITKWVWNQTAGPVAVSLSGKFTPTPSVSGLTAQGTYSFVVTVTDDEGATATDTMNITAVQVGQGGGIVSGELKEWHRVTVDFQGPSTSETASNNPFRNYRLLVDFHHVTTGKNYTVPGYFAADGDAANSGAKSGQVWRAHFVPSEPGTWTYTASFRQGSNVATSLSPTAGSATSFDGATDAFVVAPTNAAAKGFRSEGRISYSTDHYLHFEGSNRAFLQGGTDSPENLLGYVDFDQTPDGNHAYAPHLGDWQAGDPVWKGNKGKGLIGALNYLAGKGMNSVYFLTFNVGGDGDDVWPWTAKNERFRFDVSKLDQWEIVFNHMDDVGLQLHMVTQEQENDNGSAGLDSGSLGAERMLYYRELVARFGHHLGVIWNLGEENTNTDAQRTDFFNYIRAIDPYDHPIVVHTYPEDHQSVYSPALDSPILEGATLQNLTVNLTHANTLLWRNESIVHDTPWIVTLSEFGPSNDGVVPDSVDYWHDQIRIDGLWGNLMAGGGGVEWYFGYDHPHNDLTAEDWRSRDHMWELTDIALDFFQERLPFTVMEPYDWLVSGSKNWCLARPGQVYAVYLTAGGSAQLNLGGITKSFKVRWYDPRLGGPMQTGTINTVTGPGTVNLGNAPYSTSKDWAILVEEL